MRLREFSYRSLLLRRMANHFPQLALYEFLYFVVDLPTNNRRQQTVMFSNLSSKAFEVRDGFHQCKQLLPSVVVLANLRTLEEWKLQYTTLS